MNKTVNRQWAIAHRATARQSGRAIVFVRNKFFHNLTVALMNCRTKLLSPFAYCLLPIAFCLFLIGCGAKHPTLSDAHLSAVNLNQRAESAFKKGDYENALGLYNEALKISRSIEHTDGIAINIINIAVIYRKIGDRDIAHKQIDEILNISPIDYNPKHLSEAAFLKALLYFDEKSYEKALQWTDRALSFCQSPQCNSIGKVYNLKARAYLEKGDVASAIPYGDKGLESNRSHENKHEEANSLRILAEAKLIKGQYDEAKKFYTDALAIDKVLGLASKIAIDLIGIGNAACRQGKTDEAVEYFKRAISVSEASEDKAGTAKIKLLMQECLTL